MTDKTTAMMPATRAPDPIDDIRAANQVALGYLEKDFPEVVTWLKPLDRFGANLVDGAVLVTADGAASDGSCRYTIRLFTGRHAYTLSLTKRPDARVEPVGHTTYLGAAVSGRTPRAGLDYAGGRDLADGPCTRETWNRILAGIVAYELVRLGK